VYKAGKRLAWARQQAHETPNLPLFLVIADTRMPGPRPG